MVCHMPIRPATHYASGHARRAALLEAAIEVLAEYGVRGASHRAIAAKAGMPLSTTSYFFASLDELITAALQVVADRVIARTNDQIERFLDSRLSVDEAIDRYVDAELASPAADVVAQFEVYLECARRPALQPIAHELMTSFEQGAEAALQAAGLAHASERAPTLVALLDGFALHRRARPRGTADRTVLRDALRALLRAYQVSDAQAD